MPFGLTNTPASFQSLMNDIFFPFLRKFVLIFFNGILVYSSTREDYLHHLRLTLEILREHRLYAKRSKCSFRQSKVEYLSHLLSQQGVEANPNKISYMLQRPLPTTLKTLRGFLGLTGYYRKFIRNYGMIAAPFTAMLKKNSFQWPEKARNSFHN